MEFLDVNSANGPKLLTDFVTEEILRRVGQDNGGQGDILVQAYRRSYK
jgi:hypothetical protein